jgi:deoxyribodipyrimidine photolyase-related protein
MTIGIWILGDQLWEGQAALQSDGVEQSKTPVLLIEAIAPLEIRPYHQQKIVLVWSAMRHLAAELRQAGWLVTYTEAVEFEVALLDWIQAQGITEVRVMAPADRPFADLIQALSLPCELTLVPNNHFLWSAAAFQAWAADRKRLLMEDFYRAGRKRFGILMQDDQPIGGKWNFDQDNRQPPKKGTLNPPPPLWFEPDRITQAVMAKVAALTVPTYGQLEPFRWGVTRSQALQVLQHFIDRVLPAFGPYQDAMITGEETMWHALLSPYLNLGLLQPLEVVQAAETAYHDHHLALNSVEGFIRQVMGWREYMRGVYLTVPVDYPTRNWFNHTAPLPNFFWDASQTQMNCLHQSLAQTERTGYAHHIQRLMILSNFGLIAGISPQALENWFHAAFIDAYDWVMQTNVLGMGQFADGGLLASKPYAASANYINKMSTYCQGCRYDPKQRVGEAACPFNFLYWDFLDRHRAKLHSQGRMSFILANLDKMPPDDLIAIRQQARVWVDREGESGDF